MHTKLSSLSDNLDTNHLALEMNKYKLSAFEIEGILDVLDILIDSGIELVSYGLAPNPNGFCYEIPDEYGKGNEVLSKLDKLLRGLNKNQESFLKACCL